MLVFFNEGGADCPPIERRVCGAGIAGEHFNEGGADCPPIVASLKIAEAASLLQ